MFLNRKIVVVMPAYNAGSTLQKTYDEVMEQGIVDLVVIVDDASQDETVSVASELDHARLFIHEKKTGDMARTRRRATKSP